jgi:hypothetical protein
MDQRNKILKTGVAKSLGELQKYRWTTLKSKLLFPLFIRTLKLKYQYYYVQDGWALHVWRTISKLHVLLHHQSSDTHKKGCFFFSSTTCANIWRDSTVKFITGQFIILQYILGKKDNLNAYSIIHKSSWDSSRGQRGQFKRSAGTV